MKKLMILMLMVTNLTATSSYVLRTTKDRKIATENRELPVEEQEIEPDWSQGSDVWRDVEGEYDHYFYMQEDIQKELERVTTALMVYDALLAIIPCVVQDARKIEENLDRQSSHAKIASEDINESTE